MSRLDSFIRRMSAQRDILDALPRRLAGVPGLVMEFGLGSARTYDHLRERFPGRRIVVFESVVVEAVRPRPAPDDFVVGDLPGTAAAWPDGCAALVHADIETGDAAADAALRDWLPALAARLLAPGGFAVSGAPLPHPRLVAEPLPPGVAEGRYHVLRRDQRSFGG
ncbi:hypothetical protein D3273_16865 [Lichenibacterium minor]|uniref:S-adenosyl-L-methionine methyltransferase n=1 Tax=Lichenibacterium minor TaxID=2316528 RepID=A0A4Q2U769_9HYPH|nr:class I SAM-dependent methyltransferase [Lichenibacterium minor]RYC30857.1 hypothetical protein D3273_16865 [Lichenibacterium minor]